MKNKNYRIDTIAVHGSNAMDPLFGSVAPPLYQTSTFFFKDADQGEKLFKGESEGYIYSRMGNPTQAGIERAIAELEGGEAGLAFASGLAAIACLIFTLCKSGENFVSANEIYGGTHAMFIDSMKRLNIDSREVKGTDLAQIEGAIDENTKLVFIETPANPNLSIIDIRGCVEICKRHNLPLVVDNTFPTPFLQRPLELGADIVVHSATKYISGHGDTVAGLLVGSNELMKRVRKESLSQLGPCISPFNAWLLMRGIKTLAVRMRKHCENAEHVAEYLNFHPLIKSVSYPGLSHHPGHELAKSQMDGGFGGMIAFEINGTREDGKRVMDTVELCTLAVSLGDCDSLICHPASTTHAVYSSDELKAAGISETMIRLSVGIEDPRDICEDIGQALEQINK